MSGVQLVPIGIPITCLDRMSTRKTYINLVIMLAIQLHFPQSDSTAVITTEGSLRERNDFECGIGVAIICTTQPTPNKVVWTIDNVWVADCTFGFCTENSSIPAFYTFSHNATEGVFHLNIQPVSFQQNGKIFACEEGSGSSDTLTTEVNVLPDTSTAIDTTSNTQLVVTTGCVYPVTSITFEWYIYQVGMEAVLYTKQEPERTFNDSGCSLGDCGHTEAARVSSTLNIPSVETGDLYYFQVIVRHSATSKVDILNSTIKYRINGPSTQSTKTYASARQLNTTDVHILFTTDASSKQSSKNADNESSSTILSDYSFATTSKYNKKGSTSSSLNIALTVIGSCIAVPICGIFIFGLRRNKIKSIDLNKQ